MFLTHDTWDKQQSSKEKKTRKNLRVCASTTKVNSSQSFKPPFAGWWRAESERELSKPKRKKKKLVDNPIAHSQLEWELATHAVGILSWDLRREHTLVVMLRAKWRGDTQRKKRTENCSRVVCLFLMDSAHPAVPSQLRPPDKPI